MNTKKDFLLEPFKLKHLKFKNRIMLSAHEPSYAEDGMPKERYRLYHSERAKGGIALTMTAGSAIVSPDSPPAYNNLHAYKDEIIKWMKELTDSCHEYDTKVMVQLTHLGRRTNWNHSDWLPILSASPIREPAHKSFPKEAEDWDIERIVKDYGSAAERMKEAGLDGIEIEAYGHLLDSFWSPATNKRKDEYGGSIENRTKFSMKVINEIRNAVGKDFIVGIRLVVDEDWNNGITKEEGIKITKDIIDTKKIDFLNIIKGHIDTDRALSKVIPIQGMASSPHLNFAGEIKEETNFTVFHASKINDVATARYAIESGKLDMVGMTRAHIADPHIIKKIIEKREHEIRPCVSASYCLGRIYENNEALCIHNPATGREKLMPHEISRKTKDRKNIIIVGAGPAGLEAARVCSERGHKVSVFEALDKPGGQINLITRSKRKKDMQGIIDWRVNRCLDNKVEFNFNHFVEKKEIIKLNPDIIIIATGGSPNTDIFPGSDELATSSWDVISGQVPIEKDVVLFDDNGGFQGLIAAEIIAENNSSLEIITPERFVSPHVDGLNFSSYAKTFVEKNVKFSINERIVKAEKYENQIKIYVGSDYETKPRELISTQLIIEHGTLPNDDLYFELKEDSINRGEINYYSLISGNMKEMIINSDKSFFVYRVGDVVSSRNIHAAIYDALRLCKDM